MSWKIPLADIYVTDEEIKAVTDVLKSKWLTMGAITEKFEKKFAEMLDVKYCFAVNNCTAALHLANMALNIGKGDEVLCPALTFVASSNASLYTGAEVIFVDIISQDDFTIDPEDIKKKITNKTKAITVVHYGGFPCNMEEIMKIAKEFHLKVIEDCAHAPFADYHFRDGKVKKLGTIGDVSCFSFFGNKNMTTGEGGMVCTNDDEMAKRIKLLRSHGMTTLTYERHKGHANYYDVLELGYNYRTDELHSAIGLVQLDKVVNYNNMRRQVFKWYIEAFESNNNVIVPFKNRNLDESVFHIMPVIVKENYDEIKEKLKNAGIQTSKHYNLIPNFTLYKNQVKFKSKVELIDNIMTLPMYPTMKKEDVELVASFMTL